MKYEIIDVCGKPGVMIYMTERESTTLDVQNKINELKKQFKKVALFVGGTEPIEPVINKIINIYAYK